MPYDPSEPIDLGKGAALPSYAVRWSFARSNGPGGQNVNKVNSQASLIVSMEALAEFLSEPAMSRLRAMAGRYLNSDDELIITANDSRSQLDNRAAAVQRLQTLVSSARIVPRRRKKTRPSRGAKERRLKAKRIRSEIKAQRSKRHG